MMLSVVFDPLKVVKLRLIRSEAPRRPATGSESDPLRQQVGMKAVVISLEPWDDVWRRNQHLSVELVRQGLITDLWFVEPPARGRRPVQLRAVRPGIVAVTPTTQIPKTLGGLMLMGRHLSRTLVRNADLLWVNDPTLGVHCLSRGVPTVYDVTDDWRAAGFPARIVRRIVRAENQLAIRARTIVCSPVLQQRWRERYGVAATIVRNGIDLAAWRSANSIDVPGIGPHVGYIGTLHEHRLDIDLVINLAGQPEIGTVHLIGPNALSDLSSSRLQHIPGLRIHGPVPPRDVPSWMRAMDVLISPHLVNDFTLSLDAIKSYEYTASGRPVVATASSGFQEMNSENVHVAGPDMFAAVVGKVLVQRRSTREKSISSTNTESWASRAVEFWSTCETAIDSQLVDEPH
jgi:teichuronic acid biosynthesis glycosyltransferase TuaH